MAKLFDAYIKSYNLLLKTKGHSFFIDILFDELKTYPHAVVADIGCGSGIARNTGHLATIKTMASRMIGIEPDKSVEPPADIFDEVQHCFFEDCTIAPNTVFFAYSSMVMEHVAKPDLFLAKLYEVLKPGGIYIFLTVNKNHYFTWFARLFKTLKLDEFILNAAKGKDEVEQYHYPLAYKFNDEKTISSIAEKYGFEKPQFVYAEFAGTKTYFPGPLKFLWHIFTLKRKLIKKNNNLLSLICIIKKPNQPD